MNFITRNLKYIAAACAAAAIGISATAAFGQEHAKIDTKVKDKDRGFCQNWNWSSDERVSFNEVRELTVAAGGTIAVDAGKNGGVSVSGEDRSDVLVRACVQAWGSNDAAARAAANGIKIDASGTIKAEGTPSDQNWSVSFQLVVPRRSDLKLTAHNGGISIANVEGNIEFETHNGGVSLKNLAGDVKGRTNNGGVNVALAGNSWKGSGLDVVTTNGGVNLTMARNYAAQIETGTVNGGFKSDIPELNIATENLKGGWGRRPRTVTQSINGGGAPIKVVTTNGGIKINTLEQ